MEPITCLVCDRVISPEEASRSHRPRYFDDAVICPECVAGERDGYGENAEVVQRQLAKRAGPGGR
ncbi:MAG: hypothetical protein ACREMB_24045 [Candidatus Rokuibacteriota bacterium]